MPTGNAITRRSVKNINGITVLCCNASLKYRIPSDPILLFPRPRY